MEKSLLDQAVRLLDSYTVPKDYNGQTNPTISGAIWENLTDQIIPRVCHAYLDTRNRRIRCIVEGNFPEIGPGDSNELQRILLDPERSPWKSIRHAVTEHPKGIIIDANVPANLAVNFLIARRSFLYEWPIQRRIWVNLMEQGIDPYLAMFFSHSIAPFQERGILYTEISDFPFPVRANFPGSHGFLNLSANLDKFMMGDPTSLTGSLSEGASFRPCNVIWDGNGETLVTMSIGSRDTDSGNPWMKTLSYKSFDHFVDFVKAQGAAFEARVHNKPDVRGGVVDLQVS